MQGTVVIMLNILLFYNLSELFFETIQVAEGIEITEVLRSNNY